MQEQHTKVSTRHPIYRIAPKTKPSSVCALPLADDQPAHRGSSSGALIRRESHQEPFSTHCSGAACQFSGFPLLTTTLAYYRKCHFEMNLLKFPHFYLSERQNTEKEINFAPIGSIPDTCSSWGRAKPKPGAKNSCWGCHIGGRDANT